MCVLMPCMVAEKKNVHIGIKNLFAGIPGQVLQEEGAE